MTLEALIGAAAAEGRLVDLSVRRAGRGFQANYMHTAGNGHRVEIADDPVTALVAVLTPAVEAERSEALDDERSEDIEDMLS